MSPSQSPRCGAATCAVPLTTSHRRAVNRRWAVLGRALYETLGKRLPTALPGAVPLRRALASQFCASIGAGSVINAGAGLSSRLHLGAHAGVGEGSKILGQGDVFVGAHVTMGPECLLITGDHEIPLNRQPMRKGRAVTKSIHIGEDAYLGARVTVLPGCTIGAGAVVGAGSVVTADIPPYVVAAGNPARVLRSRA